MQIDARANEAHPRRTPADRSVSLRQSSFLEPQHYVSETTLSSTTPSLSRNHGSSGETSTAEQWFNRSNTHVLRKANNDDGQSSVYLTSLV